MYVMLLFVLVVRVVLLGKIPVRPPRGAQVTAQLANMMGYTYFLFVIFLNFIIPSLEPSNCTKFKLLMIFMLWSGCCSLLLGNKTKPQCLSMHWLHKNIWLLWTFLHF